MNKAKLFFLILCFITLSNSVPASGTEQQLDELFVELHNVCGHPIHVTAWDFTSLPPLNVELGINEKIVVLSLYLLHDSFKDLEKESISYGLKISYNTSKKFFYWEKFLVLLRKSEKSQRGGVITLALKDQSLCPGN